MFIDDDIKSYFFIPILTRDFNLRRFGYFQNCQHRVWAADYVGENNSSGQLNDAEFTLNT